MILHCMNLLGLDAQLISVDLAENLGDEEVGYLVDRVVPEMKPRWTKYVGCTVVRKIEEIAQGGKIDFLVLDAAHLLPGEALDFLTIFPYLADDAVVVSHDVLCANIGYTSDWIATGVLFSTVAAEKYILRSDPSNHYMHNIGAFRVTPDTKNMIVNVFLGLQLPWQSIPGPEHMSDYLRVLEKNYPPMLFQRVNISYVRFAAQKANQVCFDWTKVVSLQKRPDSSIVIWGARGLGAILYAEMHNCSCDASLKGFPPLMQGKFQHFFESVYFLDNAKEELKKQGYNFYPMRDKAVLQSDELLDAVIIGAQSEASKQAILGELHDMGIPDEKIYYAEDFIDHERMGV